MGPDQHLFHLVSFIYMYVPKATFKSLLVYENHYENTPILIYIESFTSKTWKFSDKKKKNSNIFHISVQNIDCGYLLEPSWQLCFWAWIWKIMYTPVNPTFAV